MLVASGAEQGARDLLEGRQRRVDLSASESAAAPASPMLLSRRLLQGEEG
jgi:hypothetical protein